MERRRQGFNASGACLSEWNAHYFERPYDGRKKFGSRPHQRSASSLGPAFPRGQNIGSTPRLDGDEPQKGTSDAPRYPGGLPSITSRTISRAASASSGCTSRRCALVSDSERDAMPFSRRQSPRHCAIPSSFPDQTTAEAAAGSQSSGTSRSGALAESF